MKTLMNVTLMVTITVTSGPLVLTKFHFTTVNVTNQDTTVMVSSVLMLMSVTSLLATIALMVKIVSVTISMVSTIALVPMVITQPTMIIPSALISTSVLREDLTAMSMLPVPIPMVVSNALAKKVLLVKAMMLDPKWVVLM